MAKSENVVDRSLADAAAEEAGGQRCGTLRAGLQGVDLVVLHGVLDRVDDLDGVERKLRAAGGADAAADAYAISTTARPRAV